MQNKTLRKRGRPVQEFKLQRVNITVDPTDWKAVEELSNEVGTSAANLVRIALRDLLKRKAKGKIIAI